MNYTMSIIISLVIGLGIMVNGAQAMPVVLGSSIQCSRGNQQNGIAIGDVTGNLGGATDCWGTLDGNDPGPSGDGFEINGMTFDFVAKEETPAGGVTGADIGLNVDPDTASSSGRWSYNPSLFSADAFLIVLKAASSPGFGVWSFEGTDAASFSGDWSVAWGKDLSHFSIYAKNGTTTLPIPGSAVLLSTGLAIMLGYVRRRNNE